jgi:hypothetical protein
MNKKLVIAFNTLNEKVVKIVSLTEALQMEEIAIPVNHLINDEMSVGGVWNLPNFGRVYVGWEGYEVTL